MKKAIISTQRKNKRGSSGGKKTGGKKKKSRIPAQDKGFGASKYKATGMLQHGHKEMGMCSWSCIPAKPWAFAQPLNIR